MPFWGHSENAAGIWDLLSDHLRLTAGRAAVFAQPMGWTSIAYLMGLLHDLGKYADQFQCRLADAEVRAKDHWTVGAVAALHVYRRAGFAAALAIQGHHVGLPDIGPTWKEHLRNLADLLNDDPDQLSDADLSRLMMRWRDDGFALPPVADTPRVAPGAVSMFDVRMLFSTLVDADFLETEAHFNGTAMQPRRYRPNGPSLDTAEALRRLRAEVATLASKGRGGEAVQQSRDALWTAALEAAERPTGLFTLTAPTGAGKTLAMLGFALAHAHRHKLRRVVLVMPFLNIIEQTAKTYRDLFATPHFPEGTVLEDHSLAEVGTDKDDGDVGDADDAVHRPAKLRRLLAENWDSPIVLTSHVKCLESLMAHRPGRCRKLHRLANSVILFDEVQSLPPELATATLATLARLAEPAGPYKSSVLFATATQPAFDHLDARVRALNPVGWQPTEVVPKPAMAAMFRVAGQRVRVAWRHSTPIRLAALASELADHPSRQVLAVVNLKRHAAELATQLREAGVDGVQHLSTSLCPAHRQRVLDTVTAALKEAGRPLRLISTQCVEAGVDLDFPTVYRAMAPLEAIAQAAGRCNRHGGRSQPGQVVVIKLDDGDGRAIYPPGYATAVGATEAYLKLLQSEHGDLANLDILNNPNRLRHYYRALYDLSGRSSDVKRDERELIEAITAGQFAEVDRLYRVIKGDTINVLVPDDRGVFEELVAELESDEPRTPESVRRWVQRARPLTVSIYCPDESPAWSVLSRLWFSRRRKYEEGRPDWWYLLPEGKYDRDLLGLQLPEEMPWVM